MLVAKQCQGLTLLESLIALGIVAVILVAAVPTFTSLYQEYHLTTTVEHLHHVLQLARSTAIQNNQSVYVVFQTGDNWCYGINAGATCSCNVANSCTLGSYSRPRLQDLSLTTTGLTSNTFTFEGTHGASNVSSTITFTIYNQSKAAGLMIKPLGSMQICSSSISGYPACT